MRIGLAETQRGTGNQMQQIKSSEKDILDLTLALLDRYNRATHWEKFKEFLVESPVEATVAELACSPNVSPQGRTVATKGNTTNSNHGIMTNL